MLGEADNNTATDASGSITNVQEQGVDEGDIVKAHGEYLIVLSRGRLFSVKVRDGETALLTPVFKGPAYPEGFTDGTWYDELLVSDDTIVVVGYSYAISATQVGIFDFAADGTITHRESFFIDSNDYYSSRNYASRLVDGKLIFYMPYYFSVYADERDNLTYNFPQIRHWTENNDTTEPEDIINATDIYKPVQTDTPTLHMLVTCDLANAVTCTAKGVLGPYARNYYVSPASVYLWVSDTENYYAATDETSTAEPNAYVYTMPLDGSGVGVVKAYGVPIDQFSFKETVDGYLNVLVQEYGSGDAMWWSQGDISTKLALVRFPLSLFSKDPVTINSDYYRVLPEPETSYYSLQNRFVGDYLVYGAGEGWFETPTTNTVYVVNYPNATIPVEEVVLESGVDRIEVLDSEHAVVVGSAKEDLVFTWLGLTTKPVTQVDSYKLANASQGETRSHGFFYSSAEQMLGLPIRTGGNNYGWEELYDASAEVLFLSLADNKFTALGSLTGSTSESSFDDKCKFSCTDWYGNSRPIFYDDRIFALMGYDLVEGNVSRDTITEVQRINIFETSQND
ncbi:MAG: hypothetical protein ACD_43C00141G0004 [uncultured bacterium]|nr:MAG: hypothetical protein ACD_43C00141G0004 [uncultured bacterium]